MVNKKRFLLLSIAIVLLILPMLAFLVSAQNEAAPTGIASVFLGGKTCSDTEELSQPQKIYCTWLGGITGGAEFNLFAEFIKLGILIIVILLVWSALSYVKFPESAITRAVLAAVVGILGTLFLTPADLVTTIQAYSALAIALSIFLPILILGFFTVVVASKGAPFGILTQKILWLVFSLYLLFKTISLWVIMHCIPFAGDKCPTSSLDWLYTLLYKYAVLPLNSQTVIDKFTEQVQGTPMYTPAILVILVIVSIFVLVAMVWKNDSVEHWLAYSKVLAEKESAESTLRRATAHERAEAEALGALSKK